MAFGIHHLHLKTRDPKGTMQFYVDNLGATLVGEAGAHGYRVNLHGLQLNITPIIETQSREQHYGMEHIGVDTDDYTATLARFRANGVRVLEEVTLTASDLAAYPWLPPGVHGRRVCFLEAPDGVQVEVIEKK